MPVDGVQRGGDWQGHKQVIRSVTLNITISQRAASGSPLYTVSDRQNIRQGRLQAGVAECVPGAFGCLGQHPLAGQHHFGHLAEQDLQREGGHGNQSRPRECVAESLGEIGIRDGIGRRPVHRSAHRIREAVLEAAKSMKGGRANG